MQIQLLTIHAPFNLGAMLQAYATQRIFEKAGSPLEILDYYPRELEAHDCWSRITSSPVSWLKFFTGRFYPPIYRKIRNFKRFRREMKLTERYFSREELVQNPPACDLLVIGSDQVWNMEHGCDPFWFGGFMPPESMKMSFSSSFGSLELPEGTADKLPELLRNFIAISVREQSGCDLIARVTGYPAVTTLDPTLLLTREDWGKLAEKADLHLPDEFRSCIVTMSLPDNPETKALLGKLREAYRAPVVEICPGLRTASYADYGVHDLGPFEMLALFNQARAVCTGSFHGLAFALNFQKDFWVCPLKNGRNSRMTDLLERLHLTDRLLGTAMPSDLASPVDFESGNRYLDALREKSMEFLKEALVKAEEILRKQQKK